jgi:hypothetical protein
VTVKYRSGEEIRKGDRVLFHGNPAEIEFVASDPFDPTQAWYTKEYGECITVLEPMVSGNTLIPGDHIPDYEDLEFVSRG